MHRLQNSVFLITFIFALAFASGPRAFAGTEIQWNNAANNSQWSTTGSNWWMPDATTTVPYPQGSAVVFGADNVPDGALARPATIAITEPGGVTIAASDDGTNPGMIVTGTGNWNFTFTAAATGTAANNIGISDDPANPGAGVLMQGTGTLTFSTTTAYTGATNVTAGTLRLAVANAIAQTRALNLASAATLDLAGNNQTLLALNLAPGANVFFNSDTTAVNYAKLTLNSLSGGGATFTMRADVGANNGAGAGDQIVLTTGSNSGAYTLVFAKTGTTPQKAGTSLLVVSTPQGGDATFSGSTEALGNGAYIYNVEKATDGWRLNEGTSLTRAAAAAIASAAIAGQDWHYGLDTLYKHMGDLREPPYGGDGAAGAQGGAGNLWMRANYSRLNACDSLTGYAFHEYNYGATIGADKALAAGAADSGGGTMLWFAGAFADIQRVTRGFDNGGNGSTSTLGGGLYLSWLHADGWYADLIARIDRNKNKFAATASDNYVTNADYSNATQGISLEFGRQFHWPQDWWLEPAVQCALANIGGANYTATAETAAGPIQMPVRVASALATQTRFQFRFGEDGGDNPGWHPYAALALVYSSTSDGRVRIADQNPMSAKYDGWRWEVGFGAAYVINTRSQFYYSYEYAHATNYSRPWTLSAGYRMMW